VPHHTRVTGVAELTAEYLVLVPERQQLSIFMQISADQHCQ
jgi:hypothetical protein